MKTFSHVVQPSIQELRKGLYLKGLWNKKFFKNNNPIVLELGCGKGEYSLGLAEKYPNKNFLGIDIKGARMWVGAKITKERGIKNVGFLRSGINFIDQCFDKDEIDEIWITFPDPQIKKRKARKRLTHPGFLEKYSKVLKKKGIIHLKTDSKLLFDYTLEIIEKENYTLKASTSDLYNFKIPHLYIDIKTYYENIFLSAGERITYLCFTLD